MLLLILPVKSSKHLLLEVYKACYWEIVLKVIEMELMTRKMGLPHKYTISL